jgi:hypothetical protein
MAVNYVGQRAGRINGDNTTPTSSRALFLKLYAGEVMTAFQTKNIMMDYCRVRSIKNGKSAQFIMTGKNRAAAYHTPGNELIPNVESKHTERLVTIDDLLVAHQFIPNIDEAMSHFDIRSVYTAEAAYGLAKEADQNILRMAVKGALTTNKHRASLAIQDYAGWDEEDFTANVTYGNYAESKKAGKFMEGVIEAKRILEAAGAPMDDLVCIIASDLYYHLFKATTNSEATSVLHMFNRDVGGSGSVVGLDLPTIAGIPVVRTPHLGSDTGSAWSGSLWSTATSTGQAPLGAAESNRAAHYNLPATTNGVVNSGSNIGAVGGLDGTGSINYTTEAGLVRALVMSKDAVATVKLMDLSVESEYQIQRQGTLLVAKYAMGHNILRPGMAVALKASANS